MSLQGNVKWFDMKKGFGIIRIVTPNSDILNEEYFVHYSNIVTKENNYKRLCPGEYVSFDLTEANGEGHSHTHHAINVTGILGGNLMCDVPRRPRNERSDNGNGNGNGNSNGNNNNKRPRNNRNYNSNRQYNTTPRENEMDSSNNTSQ